MAAAETVVSVKPPEPIRDFDHLGVQAPCIALYSQLLPDITNVTDRARYYSFHPWVIWACEQRYPNHFVDEFRHVLRGAKCLFALIAIRHARVVGDIDVGLHGWAMVSRVKLLRIAQDAEGFALEDYATLEGPNRYIQNKLGRLGRYYFGPLHDLRVLDHHEGAGYPGYDDQRGRKLAESFASPVREDAFVRVLEQQTTTWEELDEHKAFCQCKLHENTAEHELLSIAVQGDFASVLRAIERDEARKIRQASDAADVAVRLLAALDADLKLPLDPLVTRVRGTPPALADWQNEDHELQRG